MPIAFWRNELSTKPTPILPFPATVLEPSTCKFIVHHAISRLMSLVVHCIRTKRSVHCIACRANIIFVRARLCGCGLKWHHCDFHRNLGFECGRYCLPRARLAKPTVIRKRKLIAPSDEDFPPRHLCNSALRILTAPTLGNSHGAKRTRLVEDLEALMTVDRMRSHPSYSSREPG